jgi:hypothetical protein
MPEAELVAVLLADEEVNPFDRVLAVADTVLALATVVLAIAATDAFVSAATFAVALLLAVSTVAACVVCAKAAARVLTAFWNVVTTWATSDVIQEPTSYVVLQRYEPSVFEVLAIVFQPPNRFFIWAFAPTEADTTKLAEAKPVSDWSEASASSSPLM